MIIASMSISLDGYGAGPDQSLENPLGVNGMEVHSWFFPTRSFSQMTGREGGTTGIDESFAARITPPSGAVIMGRNMFGPVRGPWPDEEWRGWWGDTPPYQAPVFVLTRYARKPIEMKGGTTFYFITDGIESALEKAKAAAGDKDIRIGGGPSTIRQYLAAGLIDEMHLVLRPILLGRGEPLFEGLDLRALGYKVTNSVQGERGLHVMINKQK